jgi:hypothetical protein
MFIVLGLFDPCIYLGKNNGKTLRGTPDLLAHYRIKVITTVQFSKAHSKGKVHKNRQNRQEAQSSEFSINWTTENNTFLTWYRHFRRKMVGSDSRCHSSNPKTLPSIKTIGTCKFSNPKTWPNVKLENNYHIPDLVLAFPKKMVG